MGTIRGSRNEPSGRPAIVTAKRPAAAVVLALAIVAAGTAVLLVGCDEVTPDTQPSFGVQTVSDQTYTVGEAIASLVLPGASGGNAPLSYSLTPTVPGLRFSPSTRTLWGRPTAAAEGVHAMTYRVEDADGDAATLTFDLRIDSADTEPGFGPRTVADRTYTVGVAIASLVLPEASGGNAPLTYSLTPEVPGLRFYPSTRTLSGRPTVAAEGVHTMTYRVEDVDGDAATLNFEVRIDPADTQPSFGAQTVSDQAYTVGEAIAELVLPAASGGEAPLSYTLVPDVPGLTFDPATRTLTGTPTATAEGDHAMTYRVADRDGDEATLSFDVRVKPAPVVDARPSFGAQTVPDQTWVLFAELVLPKASGGDPPLSYSLTPNVPGLRFDPSTRILSGTPTEGAEGAHAMTYLAEDVDGDPATLSFNVRVNPPSPAYTDEDGCWRTPPGCVAITIGQNTFYPVISRGTNNCGGRVYARFCNEAPGLSADGDCGAGGIRDGGTKSWATSKGHEPTGRTHWQWVGSTNWIKDWVCTGKVEGWHDPPVYGGPTGATDRFIDDLRRRPLTDTE